MKKYIFYILLLIFSLMSHPARAAIGAVEYYFTFSSPHVISDIPCLEYSHFINTSTNEWLKQTGCDENAPFDFTNRVLTPVLFKIENIDTLQTSLDAKVPTTRTINGQALSSNVTISTISGNAATATALATNGSNCSAGNYPLGVDASGAVESCTALPSLATVATTGAYSDLTGTPSLATVATSGSYNDLSNKPTIPSAQVNSDWNAVSGLAQILNKPSLAAIATSGSASDLSGTKTSAFISDFVEAAQDAVGNILSSSFVYTDGSNTIALREPSINDSPGRSLVTSTSATGFQISSSRMARVCYEGTFQTTSTIGGPASITVFLETADTNSTTPGDWTIKAQQKNSNTITLALTLQAVDEEPWSICRDIEAAKYVRIRSGSVTGTATATINSTQQETLQ